MLREKETYKIVAKIGSRHPQTSEDEIKQNFKVSRENEETTGNQTI